MSHLGLEHSRMIIEKQMYPQCILYIYRINFNNLRNPFFYSTDGNHQIF